MAFAFAIPNLLDICGKFPCAPEIQSLAAENLPPSEFITALQQGKKSAEAVQALARLMPDEKAVEWAVESAKMGGEAVGLSEAELKALDAALGWSQNPVAETQAAALAAAQELPASSPAYWAANAAGFAQPDTELLASPELAAMAGDASSQFSAGSVLLAAQQAAKGAPVEIPQAALDMDFPAAEDVAQSVAQAAVPEVPAMTPKQLEEAAKILEPFIRKGLEIAQTVPGWG